MADDENSLPTDPSLSSEWAEVGSPLHSFNLMLQDARQHSADADVAERSQLAAQFVRSAESVYQRAIAHAQEWQMGEHAVLATRELSGLYMRAGKYSHALEYWQKVARLQTQSFGPNHMSLAETTKNIGICHLGLRQIDEGIEQLRDAVLRYQTGADAACEDLLDALCVLSTAYRQKGRIDRARTCIRQAFAITSGDETAPDLQAKVLDELGAVLFARHKVRSAITAYLRALRLKQQVYGQYSLTCADTLIRIGMCQVELHNYGESELAFVPAIEILHRSGADRRLLGETLAKLAGVLRPQGRFVEASIIEQGSSEIIGRAVDQGLGFFKQVEAGRAAQLRGHLDVAQSCYRQALRDLEWTFDKQQAVRVPITCCLIEIAETRKQTMQAKSMIVEVEENIREIFSTQCRSTIDGIFRLARIFRTIGYNILSDSCYRYIENRYRQTRDPALVDVLSERSQLVARLGSAPEARRMETLVRRLRRLQGITVTDAIVVDAGIDESFSTEFSQSGDAL